VLRELRASLRMLLALTLVTGVLYPLVVTGIARLVFPRQAGGSLVLSGGRVIGSELLGQSFTDPGYFQGRPSSTGPTPYDASASAGSNLAVTGPAWRDSVARRVAALRAADPGNAAAVPADLVMASASGLDPDISPAAAAYQVARVARARGLDSGQVRQLVERRVRPRLLGVLGEPRVNVLALNRDLDALAVRFAPDSVGGTLQPPGAPVRRP
jgi:potassium-transporting ATPase KdpC subunit